MATLAKLSSAKFNFNIDIIRRFSPVPFPPPCYFRVFFSDDFEPLAEDENYETGIRRNSSIRIKLIRKFYSKKNALS